jgi:hypothetical protein
LHCSTITTSRIRLIALLWKLSTKAFNISRFKNPSKLTINTNTCLTLALFFPPSNSRAILLKARELFFHSDSLETSKHLRKSFGEKGSASRNCKSLESQHQMQKPTSLKLVATASTDKQDAPLPCFDYYLNFPRNFHASNVNKKLFMIYIAQ